MKKTFSIMMFIILIQTFLYADEIHLLNKKVIKCKVSEVLKERIKYVGKKDKRFTSVEKNSVEKIVYDDGKVIRFVQLADKSENPASATGIIMHVNGKMINFDTLIDKGEYINYTPKGTNFIKYLQKKDIKHIKLGTQEEIFLRESMGLT